MNNSILINKSLNVNDFNAFIEEEILNDIQIQIEQSILAKFLKTVPKIHHSYIKFIVKKQYNNNAQPYINSVPLFKELFSQSDTDICNDNATGETKKARRIINKKRKELLLYSAQLLQLIGKNRCKILTRGLLTYYKDEMKRADDYVKSHKLIRSNGRIYGLTSVEKKQKHKIAQILRISKCINQIANDKGFTYSLITLTLPPVFHSLPLNGNNTFIGLKPSQAHSQLMKYWQLVRANFSKNDLVAGEDYIGLQTVECQSDSTLHLHALVYHSKQDTKLIHDIVYGVANRSQRFVKFDIRLNDGRASGATYVFKYITKTNQVYTEQDDNSLKNSAARFFYGARGFSFFGIKNTITQFNFLHDNYMSYEKYFCQEIRAMFQDRDYYLFITKYAQFFENVSYTDETNTLKFMGVTFDLSANSYKTDRHKLKDSILKKPANKILIEKKQYCIFETYEGFDNTIETVHSLALDEPKNLGVSCSYEYVQKKQETHDDYKNIFINSMSELNIKIHTVNTFDKITEKGAYHFKTKADGLEMPTKLHLFSIIQVKPENQEVAKPPNHKIE